MLAFEKKGSSKPWLNSPKKNFKLPEASSVQTFWQWKQILQMLE